MDNNPKKINGEMIGEPTEQGVVESGSAEEPTQQEPELLRLREQLKLKEQEAKNNFDRFLRQAAELENFKKRTTRERDDAIRFANQWLIKDLLPVLDNMERTVAHAKGGGNSTPLVEGMEMVLKNLVDVLNKHGVAQVNAAGQPFDPGKHEAMVQVESETLAPNTVLEEHHKGYLLHDRLLRPALVTVAKAPITKKKKTE